MSLRRLSIAWCILMCTLASAKAHEVQIGLEQGLDGDSNVFSSPDLQIADGVYRFTPTIKLQQPDSTFSYRLEYRPTYSGYFDTDGINGWDHVLRGRTSLQLSGRDELRFDGTFIDALGLRHSTFTNALGQVQLLSTQLGTTKHFDANVALDHMFAARTTGTMSLNYNLWDYRNANAVSNQGFGARAQLTHAPSARWTVGVNVDARYRSFEQFGSSPASFSTVLNANLLATLQFTDRTRLELSGGPAGVFSRQRTPPPSLVSRWSPVGFNPIVCPVGPCGRVWGPIPAPPSTSNCFLSLGVPLLDTCGLTSGPVSGVPGFPDELVAIPVDPSQNVFGRSDESLTYFVSLRLVRKYRRGAFSLAFTRNEGAGSGVGSTTIANSGVVSWTYSLSDFWRVDTIGTYLVRESVSRFPTTEVSARPSNQTFGGSTLAEAAFVVARIQPFDFEQRIGVAEITLQRRLGQHSRVKFRFRYYHQSQNVAIAGSDRVFDTYIGGIFYVYEFEPYRF